MQVSEIRRYLQNQMKMTIVDIKDPDAIVEGGDVLFTGKYLIFDTLRLVHPFVRCWIYFYSCTVQKGVPV